MPENHDHAHKNVYNYNLARYHRVVKSHLPEELHLCATVIDGDDGADVLLQKAKELSGDDSYASLMGPAFIQAAMEKAFPGCAYDELPGTFEAGPLMIELVVDEDDVPSVVISINGNEVGVAPWLVFLADLMDAGKTLDRRQPSKGREKHIQKAFVDGLDVLTKPKEVWRITPFGYTYTMPAVRSGQFLKSRKPQSALRDLAIQHGDLAISEWRTLGALILRRWGDFERPLKQTNVNLYELAAILGYSGPRAVKKGLEALKDRTILHWGHRGYVNDGYGLQAGPLSHSSLDEHRRNRLAKALLECGPLLDDDVSPEVRESLAKPEEVIDSVLSLNSFDQRHDHYVRQLIRYASLRDLSMQRVAENKLLIYKSRLDGIQEGDGEFVQQLSLNQRLRLLTMLAIFDRKSAGGYRALAMLSMVSNASGHHYISNKELAKWFCCSESSVGTVLNRVKAFRKKIDGAPKVFQIDDRAIIERLSQVMKEYEAVHHQELGDQIYHDYREPQVRTTDGKVISKWYGAQYFSFHCVSGFASNIYEFKEGYVDDKAHRVGIAKAASTLKRPDNPFKRKVTGGRRPSGKPIDLGVLKSASIVEDEPTVDPSAKSAYPSIEKFTTAARDEGEIAETFKRKRDDEFDEAEADELIAIMNGNQPGTKDTGRYDQEEADEPVAQMTMGPGNSISLCDDGREMSEEEVDHLVARANNTKGKWSLFNECGC